jgi:hypothetical protein
MTDSPYDEVHTIRVRGREITIRLPIPRVPLNAQPVRLYQVELSWNGQRTYGPRFEGLPDWPLIQQQARDVIVRENPFGWPDDEASSESEAQRG